MLEIARALLFEKSLNLTPQEIVGVRLSFINKQKKQTKLNNI